MSFETLARQIVQLILPAEAALREAAALADTHASNEAFTAELRKQLIEAGISPADAEETVSTLCGLSKKLGLH